MCNTSCTGVPVPALSDHPRSRCFLSPLNLWGSLLCRAGPKKMGLSPWPGILKGKSCNAAVNKYRLKGGMEGRDSVTHNAGINQGSPGCRNNESSVFSSKHREVYPFTSVTVVFADEEFPCASCSVPRWRTSCLAAGRRG